MKRKLLFTISLIWVVQISYSQSNTSLGSNAGNAGTNNTSVGYYAGRVVSGTYNSFFGSHAGFYNNSSNNTFVGGRSGFGNSSGYNNTYLGAFSGYNSTGSRNVFIGYQAGYNEPGSDKLYIDNTSAPSPLIYGDFSTDVLAVNGKLGIGTQNPLKLLHLDANNTRNGLSIYSGSDGNVFSDIELNTKNQEGFLSGQAKNWIISHRKDGYFSGSENTGSSLEFYSSRMGGGYFAPLVFKANGDVLLASPKQAVSGKVGVGIQDPQAKFEIYHNGSLGGKWDPTLSYLTIAGFGSSLIMDSNEIYTDNSLNFGSSYTHDITFRNIDAQGSEELMVIKPSGNIGIGTSTPETLLEVYSETSVAPIRMTSNRAGGADSYLEFKNKVSSQPNSSISLGLWDSMDGLFVVKLGNGESGPQEKFRINANGNVGIGTMFPGEYKLAVNGEVKVKEINVSLDGWSDFVFEENYDLPSLSEVEAHIKEKKHLLNIPSASEVEENGVNLGKMDALLLQKIEELTLYMIEQEKQIVLLKAEIKELKN